MSAFRVKRTCASASIRSSLPLLTESGHEWPPLLRCTALTVTLGLWEILWMKVEIQRAHETVGGDALFRDDLDLRRIAERRADVPVISMQIPEAHNRRIRLP